MIYIDGENQAIYFLNAEERLISFAVDFWPTVKSLLDVMLSRIHSYILQV